MDPYSLALKTVNDLPIEDKSKLLQELLLNMGWTRCCHCLAFYEKGDQYFYTCEICGDAYCDDCRIYEINKCLRCKDKFCRQCSEKHMVDEHFCKPCKER